MASTQRVVAGFFISVWVLLIGLRIAAADTIHAALGIDEPAESIFIAAISVLSAVILVGIVRRWRWLFWLVLLAFLGGAIRVPASALELGGVISSTRPSWYVALQGGIGVAQVIVAILMVRRYRRAGIWG